MEQENGMGAAAREYAAFQLCLRSELNYEGYSFVYAVCSSCTDPKNEDSSLKNKKKEKKKKKAPEISVQV